MSSEEPTTAQHEQAKSEPLSESQSQPCPPTSQVSSSQSTSTITQQIQLNSLPLQTSTTRASAPPFQNLAPPSPPPTSNGNPVVLPFQGPSRSLASPPSPLFFVSPVPSTYAPRPGVTISFPVIELSMLKGRSEVVHCTRCGNTGFSETRTIATWKTHTTVLMTTSSSCCAAATCIVFWPLVCLPYLVPECSDVEHDCARCGAMLAKYERKHKTTQVYQTCQA
ncbi:hypothetical protein JCM5353_006976 [Sporobolomyces roseus]